MHPASNFHILHIYSFETHLINVAAHFQWTNNLVTLHWNHLVTITKRWVLMQFYMCAWRIVDFLILSIFLGRHAVASLSDWSTHSSQGRNRSSRLCFIQLHDLNQTRGSNFFIFARLTHVLSVAKDPICRCIRPEFGTNLP